MSHDFVCSQERGASLEINHPKTHMKTLIGLVVTGVIWIAPSPEIHARSLDDTLPRRLTSYVRVFGGYSFAYRGNSEVEIMDEWGPSGISVPNSDLFTASPNASFSIGTSGDGFGIFVGINYSGYRFKSAIQTQDAFGSVAALVPLQQRFSVYNLELGLEIPFADPYSARYVPMFVPSVLSAGDRSFFQERGRLFHFMISTMVIIKVGSRSESGSYLGLIPCVSYDLGREDKLPASLFIRIGLGWFIPRK
jgi:hypothetical protein